MSSHQFELVQVVLVDIYLVLCAHYAVWIVLDLVQADLSVPEQYLIPLLVIALRADKSLSWPPAESDLRTAVAHLLLVLELGARVLLEPVRNVRPEIRIVCHPSSDKQVPVGHLDDPVDHSFHPLVEALVFRDDLGEKFVEPTFSKLLEWLGGRLGLKHVLE